MNNMIISMQKRHLTESNDKGHIQQTNNATIKQRKKAFPLKSSVRLFSPPI